VSEGILSALVDAGYAGVMRRVNSRDTFIPLGDAASLVLVSEAQIEAAARDLVKA
jgi:2-oxoisovalerate dehydrogenase E1 component